MGAVWQAEQLSLRAQVAIKFIQIDSVAHPDAMARFLREAQLAASLRSPHVVQIIDHGIDGNMPYIAMELLEGETLADRLERVGQLDHLDVARILTHVGRAVGRAHELEIVHRDLKPDNIFLVRNDDEEIAKVLDFGIAKGNTGAGFDSAVANSTRTGDVFGTPHYMSPEQTQSAKSLDHRADIWALGVIAFECLLGRRPFEAETLGGILMAICVRPLPVPSACGPVPAGFDAWFACACAREVSERFPSAREATAELKRICEAGLNRPLPSSLPPPSLEATHDLPQIPKAAPLPVALSIAVSRESTSPKPSRAPAWAAAALGVLTLVGALFAWRRSNATLSTADSTTQPVAAASTISASPASIPVQDPPASVPAAPASDSAPVALPVTDHSKPEKRPLRAIPANSAARAARGVQLPGTGGLVNLGL